MENLDKIVPPHLNAQVYRTDTSGNHSVSYLDYIRIHSDGSVLVGSSELTGRYWDGGATVYKDIAEGKNSQTQDKRSISLLSGTADGCFIGTSKKVLLCEDNGAVSLWRHSEDEPWPMWREQKSVQEHDAAALAVDCLCDRFEYVTVGADGNAKVWDINEMICVRHYEAHTMPIFGVAVQPNSNSYFATCSHDDHVTLWDHYIAVPALELYENDCGVRCAQWLSDNKLVFGDEAGILRLMDIRNKTTYKLAEFPAAVHKLAVNQESGKVAVCCDNTIVSVCEIAPDFTCKVVYHDRHMHGNFVRGLQWDRNLLHTVGWDSVIKSHNVA